MRIGFTHGEEIRIRSRHGAMVGGAALTERVSPGIVFANFHFPGAHNVDNVTIAALDPVAKIAEFKVCGVRLEKV